MVFEIKSIIVKDKKNGQRKTRYYAEVYLAQGRKIPMILYERPLDYR
ncbi:MAG: hypothetical protein WC834_06425 [Eubacteriales bacterium]